MDTWLAPFCGKKGLANTSAGRVQSVALKYVSDLEKEIRAFKPETYWKISCDFKEGFSGDLVKIGTTKVDRLDKKTAADAEKKLKVVLFSITK